jgi:hypothetical protein
MFAALFADGRPVDSDPDTESVSLEFDTDGLPVWRCRACGEDLTETADGYEADPAGPVCWAYEPADDTESGPDYGEGPHDPERIPLSWCNRAGIRVDEAADSVTVSLSVGDPRGAFTFTLTRVPDDGAGDLAGRIVLHTPYPDEPCPHMPLTPVRPGTYLVGHPAGAVPARRSVAQAA